VYQLRIIRCGTIIGFGVKRVNNTPTFRTSKCPRKVPRNYARLRVTCSGPTYVNDSRPKTLKIGLVVSVLKWISLTERDDARFNIQTSCVDECPVICTVRNFCIALQLASQPHTLVSMLNRRMVNWSTCWVRERLSESSPVTRRVSADALCWSFRHGAVAVAVASVNWPRSWNSTHLSTRHSFRSGLLHIGCNGTVEPIAVNHMVEYILVPYSRTAFSDLDRFSDLLCSLVCCREERKPM